MIELRSVPAPADPRSASLRKAGAKAVLIGPASTSPLPFETPDSKTRVPAAPPGSVSRTALVNRLRAAGTFPLVLVSAPAGYGKTTLLSQWAARDVRPFAWVSVDEGDDDPATLLRLLAAALDRVEPLPESALEPLAAERRFAFAGANRRSAASGSSADSGSGSPPRLARAARRSCWSSTARTRSRTTRSRSSRRSSGKPLSGR
jgi:hypothetical protein